MASKSPTTSPPSLLHHSTRKTASPIEESTTTEPKSRPSSKGKLAAIPSAAVTSAPVTTKRAPLPCKPKSSTGSASKEQSSAPPQPAPQQRQQQQPPPLARISLPPADKMSMTAIISPNPSLEQQQPKMSMTSKEWVIPPRPKPGRKPATDTPPTKRKAQNRAAQRAFRERRAARVGELEELMDEQKILNETREKELNQKIHDLELDVQSFRSRCLLLESMLERERQERLRAEMQAENLSRRSSAFRSDSLSTLPQPFDQRQNQNHQQQRSIADDRSPLQLPPRHFSISQIITPPETLDAHSPHEASDASLTCGNCSPNGRCACAEEVLASVVGGCSKCGFGAVCQCLDDAAKTKHLSDLKRPVSPLGPSSDRKRQRSTITTSLETDFSDMFSKKSQQQPPSIMSQLPSADTLAFRDSCGFCKDGTYCVCADTAIATPAMTPTETPPSMARQTRTPPPSENDVIPLPGPPIPMEMTADGAVKLPRRKLPRSQPLSSTAESSSGGCGAKGPGTCAQCQADPKSGLFCRLMAANLSRDEGGSSAGGCCGGSGAGGGCCKSARPAKITLPSLPSLGLSCAEAYQTLSSHRNFERAADDISSWLPKLKATPKGDQMAAQPGRMPIEVEAASIMSVLKEFDVRFGREC